MVNKTVTFRRSKEHLQIFQKEDSKEKWLITTGNEQKNPKDNEHTKANFT